MPKSQSMEWVDTTNREYLRQLQERMDYLSRPRTGSDAIALEKAQTRADNVLRMHNTSAPPPVLGETPERYRQRLLSHIGRYTSAYRGTRFDSVQGAVLDTVEDAVYTDARATARDPSTVPPGQLRAVEEQDAYGRTITRYVGDIGAFLSPYVHKGVSATVNTNATTYQTVARNER